VRSVLQHDNDGVRVLTLARPERRNALSAGLVEGLLAALSEANGDSSVRCIVLAGSGEAFCAGGDLADGLGGDGALAGHAQRARYASLLAAMPRCRVPIVAAVHGVAYGGGLGLVATADLAVADPAAKLGTPEIRLGLFPWIILAALQRGVPRKALMEMVLTGSSITAERALALGLINSVSAPGEALPAAMSLAQRVGSSSPAVVAMGKQAFYRIADQGYEDALDYMTSQLSLNLLAEDAAEGVAAFLQKRPAVWKGR